MTDEQWFRLAWKAASHSGDPDRKVGAVVVKEGRLISSGYNRFPLPLKGYIGQQPKLNLTLHAEHLALLNCDRSLVRDSTLYSTFFPCRCCALAIVECGVNRVVAPPLTNSSSWFTSQRESLEIFKESGIKVCLYTEGML